MSAYDTLRAVGFADAARDYRQHALTIQLSNNVPGEAPPQRRLGVRLITNDDPTDPTGLQVIPAVTINEHASKYEMTPEGFSFTLDRPGTLWGNSIGSADLWYFQGSPMHMEVPPFTLPKLPFQQELRLTEMEERYTPRKSKYYDFRQDHSALHPVPILNDFDLTSKPLMWDRWDSRPMLIGEDYRNFGVLYIEFRNAENQPVVNPIYEEMEIPSRFGHFIVFDTTRSRAHIAADIAEQVRKIHPDIELTISDYEGPPMRRIQLVLPMLWSYSRPQFYFENFPVSDGGWQEGSVAHTDGKTRLYQEEIVHLNGSQGVSGTQLGSDGLSREYDQDGATPFPFPAKYLYPLIADNVVIPWGAEVDLASEEYTVEVTVPVTAYKYSAEREWQVFADLRTVPNAGDVGLKSAKWLLTTGEVGEEVTTELPAYFIRYISGTLPPQDGGIPLNQVQFAAVMNAPEMNYIERSPLKNSVVQMDGSSEIQMRVAPPPIDGYGYSPYVGIKPVEAKLQLTFHRPSIDDRFEFFNGDDTELQKAILMIPEIPKGMLPPEGQNLINREFLGTPGNPDYEVELSSELAFNWNSGFATIGVYIGKTVVEQIVELLADDSKEYEIGYDFRGTWTNISPDQLLTFVKPDGSILYPLTIGLLENETNVENGLAFVVAFYPNIPMPGPEDDIEFIAQIMVTNNIFGMPTENQALPLPFVIGNVLQGHTAEEVSIDVLLGGDVWGEKSAFASVKLSDADPTTGELFGTTFTGLDFKATFDNVAETVTVTNMGGPMGMLALSASTQTTPYAAVTLPEGAIQRNVTYTDWDDPLVATTTHPVAKNIIPLPYALDGDIFLPELAIEAEVVALTEPHRAKLGKTFTTAETAANTVTITPKTEGVPANVTVQTDLVAPYLGDTFLETAGYVPNNVHRFKRECVAVRITEPAIIQNYKAAVANVNDETFLNKAMYTTAHYTTAGVNATAVEDIMLGECYVVTENEVEVLYIAIPLYPNSAIGSLEYEVYFSLPQIGFQYYSRISFTVNATFVAPVGMTAVTQELEATQPDITSLWTAATSVNGLTIYDVIAHVDRYTPMTPFTDPVESTSWSVTPNPGSYGYTDVVNVNGYDNGGSFGARLAAIGGNDRPVAGINIIVLEGVTLPPEFVEDQGPFKFLQVGSDVQILTWFDKLTLTKHTYPFAQLTPQYIAGFDGDSWNVRLTVALDKTLLPAEILASHPSIMITARTYANFGFNTATFWHNFNSATTAQTIISAPKFTLPGSVDDLPLRAIGSVMKKYDSVYVYEGTIGPVPPAPWP